MLASVWAIPVSESENQNSVVGMAFFLNSCLHKMKLFVKLVIFLNSHKKIKINQTRTYLNKNHIQFSNIYFLFLEERQVELGYQ